MPAPYVKMLAGIVAASSHHINRNKPATRGMPVDSIAWRVVMGQCRDNKWRGESFVKILYCVFWKVVIRNVI